MEENKNPEEEQSPMTEQEMAEMRKKITAQYKEEIGFLKIQSQYEDLMATIEESKLRRYSAMARASNLFAQMEQGEKEAGDPSNAAERDFNQAKEDAKKSQGPSDEAPRKKRTLAPEN